MIQDKAMEPDAKVVLVPINVPLTTSTTASAVLQYSATPGYRFRVERVDIFATAVTATITVDVQIGAVSVLTTALTPVANTVVSATAANSGMVASVTTRTATADTDAINVRYTTNGTGAATKLIATVWIRPYPLNGEA